jgi:hypothetical protein
VNRPVRSVLQSVRILLTGLIDYAGLFPPAELDMKSAVRNYASYREADHGWALGRFIAPVSRLEEVEHAAQDFFLVSAVPWRLSILCSPEPEAVRKILDFNQRHSGPADAVIDTVEMNIPETEKIGPARNLLPEGIEVYFELPVATDPSAGVAKIRTAGGRAKVRAGGIRADLIPAPADLVRFIKTCAAANVPFKATAGLHHALRSAHKLTYDPDSASGIMHGFLNVFVGAILIQAGLSSEQACHVLEEESRTAFQFGNHGIAWRDQQVRNEQIYETRHNLAIAFGSCSFEEPIDDLVELGLL